MATVVDDEDSRTAAIAAVASRTASAPALARPRAWSAATAVSLGAVGGLRRRAGHLGDRVARRAHGAHLALGAGGDLVDGAGDLAHGAAGVLRAVGQLARGRRHGRRGQRHLADHGGQRGARGVVGLHRGGGVVADLAHGLGHVADLVARAPVDRRGDGRELEGQVAGGEVAEPVAQAGDVVAAQRGQARDDRLDAEADAADGGHAGRDGDEEDEGEQEQHEPARAVEGVGRLAGERIALGHLGVVEVLEVGAERVGGGVQALGGPLVGQLGRVGARDAEELAGDAAVGGEVVLQEARALALLRGGEGGRGGGERARDPAVVGQDALLERALGLERVLEDVAVGQPGVLVDQRPRAAERGQRLGHVREVAPPAVGDLGQAREADHGQRHEQHRDEDEQPGQLPAQRDATRHGHAREARAGRADEDASPSLLDCARASLSAAVRRSARAGARPSAARRPRRRGAARARRWRRSP